MIEALFLLLAAPGQGLPDPLAEARAGKMQCSNPDVEKKICRGLTRYTVHPGGTFEAVTSVLIATSPLVTLDVKSTGQVEKDALCIPIRKADFEAGTILVDGKPAPEAMASAIRPQVAASIAPMDGKMGCTRETPDGAVLKAEVTLDGIAHPEMTQRTLWVKPKDGYQLGM